ncbi:hypothetical protein WAI453_006830 [Rhynchosporium graminicola]|uniref:Related to TRI13-cytochrome P450 n=1 Tax=Rhynchosporium graminicola TaxID=2792576 RepID=A0A1E1KTB2_9HELO|nr:related to TRI13-cytochrome P450 [Rhynchosporium commune]
MLAAFVVLGFGLPTFLLLIVGLAVSSYLVYCKALPVPLPGIPYNKEATKSVFGDMLAMVKHVGATKELLVWMTSHNIRHQSPIFQIFARPFARPWVVVTDFREAQDVLLRRSKEFDRSKFFGDIFLGIIPKHHISMKSDDEEFKKNRRWLQDLMTPAFLYQIAAPQIYISCIGMLDVWEQKSRLAQGHPFEPTNDIYNAALDAVWLLVFGADSSNSTTKATLEKLSPLKSLNVPVDKDTGVTFPHVPLPACIGAVQEVAHSIQVSITSPSPVHVHWVIRQLPSYRRATRAKDDFIRDEVEKTRIRFEVKSEKDLDVRCAMDGIMRREMMACEKEGREPMFHSRSMYDEILGFVVAAHDTVATTLTWALKFLADNPEVQTKLRAELFAGHANARSENRRPTTAEITKSTIHYLNAVQEEIIRCSITVPAVVRTATVDTEILGKRIPKGTDVFFMGNGPSIFSPAFPIDDSLRSQSALSAKDRVGSWDPTDMSQFNPERWLVDDGNGGKEFNASAGPLLTFGMGPRGCYGRRLAYVELKIFLTLMVWSFELEKCPLDLSGYAAADVLTHTPQQCFVRPKKLA